MYEKILALLVAKHAGVRKDALAQMARSLTLTVTTEEEANGLVEKLPAEQVSNFAKEYRKYVDKEVSDAIKTFEGTLKKFDVVDKKNPESGKDPNPADPNDIASIVKAAVAEAIKPFQSELAGYKGLEITKTRLQTLEGKLKDVPETFKSQKLKDFGRISFESDESFNEYLTESEADISAFNQEMANKGLTGQGKPMFGHKNADGVSAGVAAYIADKTTPAKDLGGKAV